MKNMLRDYMQRLRTYFFTGLVTVTPIFITGYILISSIAYFDGFFHDYINLKYRIPGIGLFSVILLIIIVGFLTRYYIGKKIVDILEYMVFRIPFIKRVYSAIKQVSTSILGQNKFIFKKVVRLEYPRKGIHTLGFLTSDINSNQLLKFTEDDGEFCTVFIPTTPNPTSGYVIVVKKEDITVLEMTIEDGMKYIISAGALDLKDLSQ